MAERREGDEAEVEELMGSGLLLAGESDEGVGQRDIEGAVEEHLDDAQEQEHRQGSANAPESDLAVSKHIPQDCPDYDQKEDTPEEVCEGPWQRSLRGDERQS